MALINGLYVFVENESVQRGVSTFSHPVESGIDVTDHVSREPIVISLSGKIVGDDSWNTQSKLIAIHNSGVLVSFIGRTTIKNAQLTKFDTSHPNTIWGGCSFTAELTEVRIAQNSYTEITKGVTRTGIQQKEANSTDNNVYHTVKRGDTVWGLVAAENAPYKSYGKSIKWVLENNPDAFGEKGNADTLKTGAKLRVGERR